MRARLLRAGAVHVLVLPLACIGPKGERGEPGPQGPAGTYTAPSGSGLQVTGSNLALVSCAAGEVLRSNGSAWTCGPAGAGALVAGPGLTITGSMIDLRPCASGEVLKYTGTTWACAADNAASVTAGAGLTQTGSALSANFAGSGGASTVARSDHTHPPPGVVFTRWGHSACPAGTTLVYSGFVAGAHYQHSGSGSNTLCLSDAPGWNAPDGTLLSFNDVNQNGALIYGTELETGGYGVGALAGAQNFDARCAVCLAPARVTFMYPGAAKCPAGFATQYYGYLMAQHYTHSKSEFLCVDANPTLPAGSQVDHNGHLWYPTEAECGSLPCGPNQYIQDREITCAVCTN